MGKNRKERKIQMMFESFATKVTKFAGTPYAFGGSCIIIILWGVSGPIFNYSDTWQMVINTTTTIVTFLMVFLIQHSQNKDSLALNVKLDEVLKSIEKANDYLIDSEHLSEEELEILQQYYKKVEKENKERENEEHTKKKKIEEKKEEIKKKQEDKKKDEDD